MLGCLKAKQQDISHASLPFRKTWLGVQNEATDGAGRSKERTQHSFYVSLCLSQIVCWSIDAYACCVSESGIKYFL